MPIFVTIHNYNSVTGRSGKIYSIYAKAGIIFRVAAFDDLSINVKCLSSCQDIDKKTRHEVALRLNSILDELYNQGYYVTF